MANEKEFLENEELDEEVEVVTLVDEQTQESRDFEVIAECDIDDKHYVALVPYDEESEEYIILEQQDDEDGTVFLTIDDDDEFDKVEDKFNDLLFGEVDYDN